jgi:hypothetical protein
MDRATLFLIAILPALSSCSTGLEQSASDRLDALATFSVRDLLPARVAIVKVREGDLKDFPLGSERALAFNRQRQFATPATFIEPALPSDSPAEAGTGVLPARPH